MAERRYVELILTHLIISSFYNLISGADGAFVNRLRAVSTWGSVALSKLCNLVSPYFLAAAANQLVAGHYPRSVGSVVGYIMLRILSSIFKVRPFSY